MATLKVTNIKNESFAGDQLYLKTDGKIGIGTTSPSNALDVQAGTTNTAIVARSTDAKAQISLLDNATTSVGCVVVGAEGDSLFLTSGSGGTEALRIDSSGNVKFVSNERLVIIQNGGTSGQPEIAFRNAANTGDAYGNIDGATLALRTSGTSRLNIDGTGLIKFDNYGGTTGKGRIEFGNSGEQFIEGYDTGNAGSGSYLQIGDGSTTRIYIKSGGNVGIGTTSPSELLHVNGTASIGYLNVSQGGLTAGQKVTIAGSGNASGDDLTINNWGNADGDYWVIGTNITSNASGSTSKTNDTNRSACLFLDGRIGRMILNTSESGTSTTTDTHSWTRDGNYTLTGNVVVADGKGIDFSATTGPTQGSGSSELLDDYEEGTWTPTLGGLTANPTSIGYANQNGLYRKIGNQVTVWMRIRVNALTMGSASGTGIIMGLPFNNAGGDAYEGATVGWNYYQNWSGLSNKSPSGYMSGSQNYIRITLIGEGSDSGLWQITDCTNNLNIYGNMTYITSS